MSFSLRISMILLLSLVMLMEQVEGAGKPVTAARKQDLPYIKCSVCEALSKELIRQVNRQRDKLAPKKITELHIIGITENICNMMREQSDWIMRLDIVEKEDKLELVEHPMEGVCKTDCKTIERACLEVMGEFDTAVAEYLFKSTANRAGLQKLLCKDLSQACVGQLPSLPKDRGPGEAFTPKVGKQAEMDKLLRTLKNDSPGLRVYSRDDIANNPGIAYSGGRSPRDPDDEEDEDEDEDEEDYEYEKDVEYKKQPGEHGTRKWGDAVAQLGDNVVKLGAKVGDTVVKVGATVGDNVVRLGATVGTQTQNVIQKTSKRMTKARRRISRWWSGKKPSTSSRMKRKSRLADEL